MDRVAYPLRKHSEEANCPSSYRNSEEIAFVRSLIGDEAITLLSQSVVWNLSVRDLAELTGTPKSTLHDRLRRIKTTLEKNNLWPIIDRGCSTRWKEPQAEAAPSVAG
jgi:hypothetical protein